VTTVDAPGTWVFTFGSGQRGYAIGRYDRDALPDLLNALDALVERNRDGDTEDVTLAVNALVGKVRRKLNGEPKPEGFRLDDRYVVFRDMTHAEARGHMVHYFGAVWSGEYESLEAAGVEKYGLTELVITEDWQAPDFGE